MEERGRLDEPAVDRRAALVDAHGEPARHLGHGARVAHHPGLGIEGEQQRGGLQPPGDRHRRDGTRPPGDDRPAGHHRATMAGRRPWRAARNGGAGRTPVTGTAHRNRGGRSGRPGPPRPTPAAVPRDPSACTLTPPSLEADDDRPVAIGPQDASTGGREPIERGPGRMPVRVAGAGRGDGDLRVDRLDERLGRRGPASVVGDLEQVDARQALAEQRRVDPVLDVAHQQEPASTDLPEQDDRHVVDAGPAVGRRGRDDRGPATARAARCRRRRAGRRSPGSVAPAPRTVEPSRPCRVPGPGSAHPRLEDRRDPVAGEQQGEPGDVVLVRVAAGSRHRSADPRAGRAGRAPRGADPGPDHRRRAGGRRARPRRGSHRPARRRGWTTRAWRGRPRDDEAAGDEQGDAQDSHADATGGRGSGRSRRSGRSGRAGSPGRGRIGGARGGPTTVEPRPPSASAMRSRSRRRSPNIAAARVEWRIERHARERQARRRVDDRDQQPEDDPARRGRDRPDDRWRAREHGRTRRERDEPGRHRRRDERHDDEVDDRRQDRQPAERRRG